MDKKLIEIIFRRHANDCKGGITEQGAKDAEKLGKTISNNFKDFEIYYSPKDRTKATAEAIKRGIESNKEVSSFEENKELGILSPRECLDYEKQHSSGFWPVEKLIVKYLWEPLNHIYTLNKKNKLDEFESKSIQLITHNPMIKNWIGESFDEVAETHLEEDIKGDHLEGLSICYYLQENKIDVKLEYISKQSQKLESIDIKPDSIYKLVEECYQSAKERKQRS